MSLLRITLAVANFNVSMSKFTRPVEESLVINMKPLNADDTFFNVDGYEALPHLHLTTTQPSLHPKLHLDHVIESFPP